MKLKTASGIMLTLLLVSMLTLAFNIQPVRASGTIYIGADGSIDPPTANITNSNNVIYTFIGNVNESIVIQRDNIEVDGAGFTLQGTWSGTGIDLSGRSNVTIRDLGIKEFNCGIDLSYSSNNTVHGSDILDNIYGIELNYSSGNIVYGDKITNNIVAVEMLFSNFTDISENNMTNNSDGIRLSFSSSNRISKNNITSGYSGIMLSFSSNNVISENNITGCKHRGIYVSQSTNNTVSRNNIKGHTALTGFFGIGGLVLSDFMHLIDTSNLINGKPVHYLVNQTNFVINSATHPQVGYLGLINCVNITVEGLTLEKNSQGLLLAYTNNSRIRDNTFTKNYCGIALRCSSNNTLFGNAVDSDHFTGIELSESSNNSICESTIRECNPAIELLLSSNNTFSGNFITYNIAGVDFFHSCNNTFAGNIISRNSLGFYLSNSSSNTISGNNITNNGDGIWLVSSSSNNTFSGNNITENSWAVRLEQSSDHNSISGNNIIDNEYGIWLWDSSDNKFYHNNFIDNSQQVHIYTSGYANFWDEGYPSGGNYWSDHVCTGNPSDGSQPYVIDENNIDHYPFQDPNGWLLPPPVDVFEVVWDSKVFYVVIESNSTVSNFDFRKDQKEISFSVTGSDGTSGFCNVTVPMALMTGEPSWLILVGGEAMTYIQSDNGTHTFLYFTYTHTTHNVKIRGTWVVPEFPTWTQILLILILLTVAIVIYKRRILKTPIH